MTPQTPIYTKRCSEYAKDVIEGRILACNTVKLACKRHLDDLELQNDPKYPYQFSDAKATKVCGFIELLPHVKGKWAAKKEKAVLQPWQIFILCNIFGWVSKSTGLRRFRTAYIEVPRKNGKSFLAAAIALYMLLFDGEHAAEVYSGATTKKQAMEVFTPAKWMAQALPELIKSTGLEINAESLFLPSNKSKFTPIIGKPGDGASPSCAIVDEAHELDTPDLIDTMLTGMIAREQPLLLIITTAGVNLAGPCFTIHQDVVKILEGTLENPEMFGIIFGLDVGDDWTNPECLKKANPNFGISIFEETLLRDLRDAINSTYQQAKFKTKHENVWLNADSNWMNMERWNACQDSSIRIEDFESDPCYIAIDLSSKIDLTAVVKVFKRTLDRQDHYYVFCDAYLPEETIHQPGKNHYLGWQKSGHLKATDGAAIDYDLIEDEINQFIRGNNVQIVAFDPWSAGQFSQRINKTTGIPVAEIRQKVEFLSEPMKWLEAFVLTGQLHHNGDPVLRWCISNVVCHRDSNDGIKPNKAKPENKIDAAVATIMALSRAMADSTPIKTNILDIRSFRTL